MQGRDLDELLNQLSHKNKKDSYDYEGYAVLENLKMTREELAAAVDVAWDIVMKLDNKARDNKYLFSTGLIRSKNVFMKQKVNAVNFTGEKRDTFDFKAEIFREKLENVKPLVLFLVKIKELLDNELLRKAQSTTDRLESNPPEGDNRDTIGG